MIHRTQRRTKLTRGITLIEMCIVLLLISILMAIATPSMLRARSSAQSKTCRSQLWHIQEAKQRWAMENKMGKDDTPTKEELVPSYLKHWPACPAGGEYEMLTVDTMPECSEGGEHAIQ